MVLTDSLGKYYGYRCIEVNITLFMPLPMRNFSETFIKQYLTKEQLEGTKSVARFPFHLHHSSPTRLRIDFTSQIISM